MGKTVLESLLDATRPKKKKTIRKEHVVLGLNIASQVLSVAVLKKPGLLPVQQVLSALLQEIPQDAAPGFEARILRRIKELHAKLSLLPPEERGPVEREIASLLALMSEA
jgi:hypothetical protein